MVITYYRGSHVSQKEQISKHDYVIKCKKAASQGNVIAQNTLGFLYLNGQGVSSDYKEAVKWFKKAAEQGYDAAEFNLAIMYKLGQGVELDLPESFKWLQSAAAKGYADAQYSLGNMYFQGDELKQDYVKAYMWWLLAESNGAKDINHNKEAGAAKMSKAELQEADRLAKAWQSQHGNG